MSVEHLKSNLQELFHFSKAEPCETIALVADPIRKRSIYCSKDLRGHLCILFYKLVAFFGYTHLKKRNLFLAQQFTYKIFLKHRLEALSAANSYRSYLSKSCSGEKVCAIEASKARRTLADWHDATKMFAKMLKNQRFCARASRFDKKMVHKLTKKRQSFSRFFRIVKLESIFKKSLPLSLIVKGATPQSTFESSEKLLFQRFVKKIDKNAKECDIHFLHASLLALIEEIKPFFRNLCLDIGALETLLIEHQCQAFALEDLSHLQKRSKIHYGHKLLLNGKEYVVGNRFNPKPLEKNNSTHIYEILNSQHLLCVGPSRFHVYVKEFMNKTCSWAVPTADTIDIDFKGRFWVVDRLTTKVKNYPWSSSSDKITLEDCSIAMPIMKVCKWCIDQGHFPLNMSAKNLMFTSQSYLRCVKICTKGQFHFNKMVDLLLDLSGGNYAVYKFFVKNCGLLALPEAHFFAAVLKMAANGNEFSVINSAINFGISDSSVIQRAENFAKNIKELKIQCKNRAIKELSFKDYSTINKQIALAIINCTKKEGSTGIVAKNLQDRVISFLASHRSS